jgi:hypothetical protein
VAGFAKAADLQAAVVSADCGYARRATGLVRGMSVGPVGFADPVVSKVMYHRGAGFAGWVGLSVQAAPDRWAAPFDPAMLVPAACSAQQQRLPALK